jgi:sugar lactone lactonase YvrE/predicted SpoU family rRNA methylase
MDFDSSTAEAGGTGTHRCLKAFLQFCSVSSAIALGACTGGVTTGPGTLQESNYYTIGGTVTGLTGTGLVLQDNNGDNLPVASAGTFAFHTELARGNSYSVSVLTQPASPTQTCVVTAGTGTVTGDNVTSVAVMCANKTTPADSIGGTVSGLAGSGLVLQDNGSDNLAVASNGSFAFSTGLPSGTPYSVTVLTPPMNPFQDCTIANGSGTTNGADVNNVAVSCKTNSNPAYTIGGTITGVSNSGPIVLQDNGTDNLTVSADGSFTFATPIPSGSAYSVTAVSSTTSQTRTCSFTNASGVVGGANVSNVKIVCAESTPVVNITVNVSGLTGTGLVLQDNAADNLTITGNGAASFATSLASGTAFSVTILTQPTAQTCTVVNGAGMASSTGVPVAVNCLANTFTISANVAGLAGGAQLTLNDNGGDALLVTGVGVSTFATPIPYNGNYAVTVTTQPLGQICTVANGVGAGVTADVTVGVTCSTITYTVSAAVIGLTAGKQFTLNNNGGNPLVITANGTFAFTMPVAYNGSYAVTTSAQPVGQTCTVSNGTGAGVTANVTATVTCSTITYPVSAVVNGLTAGKQVTLMDNGADPLIVTTNGTFPFATPIAYNGSYNVTVGTQPVGETCTVANGTGAGVTASVTVNVTCSVSSFTVTATVTGLNAGQQVTLNDNGADPLIITTNNTPSAFATKIAYNGSYNVTVGTQPVGEICTVNNGSGTGVTANVTVTVNCAVSSFIVSATVTGLTAGQQVTLNDNGADPLTIAANNTPSAFATKIAYNGSYNVTVGTQPVGETCTVSNGTGSNLTANVTVTVSCVVSTFTVSATVSGLSQASIAEILAGAPVTLSDNGTDTLNVTGNATYTFATRIAYGSNYNVTLTSALSTQTCTVANGAGIATANVTVSVTCVNTYQIDISISGLTAPGLQISAPSAGQATSTYTVPVNATSFNITGILANTPYNISIVAQPPGFTVVCVVNNGSGTVTNSNVTNVSIQCVPSTPTVSLFAGSPLGKFGPVNSAPDANGNTYIADASGNQIREIDSDGIVSVVAGNGAPGSANGVGNVATFNSPTGIAVDASGNLYVADSLNNLIRKITPSAGPNGAPIWTVSTIAGTLASGLSDGTGSGASFHGPTGVAVDSAGNIFVADQQNNEIRMITPTPDPVGVLLYIVRTIAGGLGGGFAGSGDGVGTAAAFYYPSQVALASSGPDLLFVADQHNNEIRVITPSVDPASGLTIWTVTTLAGTTATGTSDGTGTAAAFNEPSGLTAQRTCIVGAALVCSYRVYVADTVNNLIRLITVGATSVSTANTGAVTTLAGSGAAGHADGTGSAASFNEPFGVSFNFAGALYVDDYQNESLRTVTTAGVVSTTLSAIGTSDGTGSAALFNAPYGVAVDSTGANIYVADTGSNEIRVISQAGVVTTLAGNPTAGHADGTGALAGFSAPRGVAVDASGSVYVADFANNEVRKITPQGVVTTLAGNPTAGSADGNGAAASFNGPSGVAVDAAGNVYVADSGNNEIRKITAAGVVTTFAGNTPGIPNDFSNPIGIAVDAQGNVYVSDSTVGDIRKITPAGLVSTLFSGTEGILVGVRGISVDSLGDIYISDTALNRIDMWSPVSGFTLLGGAIGPGYANGPIATATFNSPSGVAVDVAGNLYVADTGNNEIRKIAPQ